jgi:hypothetical protein
VDVGVQAEPISVWQIVKDWFRETFCINSSDISSLGQTRVKIWINNLDFTQSTISQDVNSVVAESHLDTLVNVQDCVSNISEFIWFLNSSTYNTL